jgi:hypothetical protein
VHGHFEEKTETTLFGFPCGSVFLPVSIEKALHLVAKPVLVKDLLVNLHYRLNGNICHFYKPDIQPSLPLY